MEPVLLERHLELDQLAMAVRDAADGHGSTVLISGEAGIGKTTLVRAFVRQTQEDTRVLVGACDDLSTPRSLGAIRDAVSGMAGGPLVEAFRGQAEREAVLTALLDEVHDPLRATVLVVDDLHWADDATLDVLRVLARRVAGLRCVLVVTFRDDEGAASERLTPFLGIVARHPHVRLPLRGLSREAVQTLASGSGLDADALHHMTRGNPFLVSELVAHPSAALPGSVVDAVAARVAALADVSRTVVEQLAVIPSTVEHWLIDALFDTPQALADLERRGIIRARTDGVVFRHELTRHAVERTIPAVQRIELNRRVLRALLDHGDVEAARVVHHAVEARDDETLITFVPLAVRDAVTAGAHRQAVAHLQRLLPHLGQLPARAQAELLETYAHECSLVGANKVAVEAQTRAIEIRRSLHEWVAVGDGLRTLARMHWLLADSDAAHTAIDAAIRQLEVLPEAQRELAWAYSARSQLAFVAYNSRETRRWGEKAIAIAEEIGDDHILLHALNNVAGALWQDGDDVAGEAMFRRSLAMALELGLGDDACRAYGNLGDTLIDHHRYAEALPLLDEAVAFAERIDHINYVVKHLGTRAELYLNLGQWDRAERDARSGTADLPQRAIPEVQARAVLATLQIRRGDPDGGRTLDRARATVENTGAVWQIGRVALVRAEAAWLSGDPLSARPALEASLEQARELGYRPLLVQLAYWWRKTTGDVPRDEGDEPELFQARGHWREAAGMWESLGCPYQRALALSESQQIEPMLEALAILDDLGATATATVVRRDLRRLGAPSIPRGRRDSTRTNPGGLTDRQVDVLRLLADGLSNAEIADQLVVSVRTVESHVSAILTRLGATDRQQAAEAAGRLGIGGR